MEGTGGEVFGPFGMLAVLFCVAPVALMLLVLLPMLAWRHFVVNRRRRGTFEGDLTHLVSEASERLEASGQKEGDVQIPEWVEKVLKERQDGPQGGKSGG